MSFVTEMEEVLDDLWGVVQDQHDTVKSVMIHVENCRYIELSVKLEDGNKLEASIPWNESISDLLKNLKEDIQRAAKYHSEEIDVLVGSVQADVDKHKKSRKKLRMLDPTPLEELAMQAE